MTWRMKGTVTGGHVVKCTNAGPRWPAGEREGLLPPGPPAVNRPSAGHAGPRSPVSSGLFRCFQAGFYFTPHNLMKYGGDTSGRIRGN